MAKDFSNSAMVALFLSPTDAVKLALSEELNLSGKADFTTPDNMHLTLALLGDTGALEGKKDAIQKVVKDIATNSSPITGTVSGIGRFTPDSDMHPVYASFDSGQLPDFRQFLVSSLKEQGVKVASDHGFTPHITLANVPREEATPAVVMASNLLLTFDKLTLAWGNETYNYPFVATMDSGLSFDDIRNLLQQAITPASQGANDISSNWVTDVFEGYFVYSTGNKLFQRSYQIEDGKVTLGDPVEVTRQTEYEPVTKVTEMAMFDDSGEWVTLRGKIFEAGDYPDKKFEITEDELKEAVKNFKPVDLDYQHVEGPLDGKLGKLSSVEAVGKDLMGVVTMPRWLKSALGDTPIKVSTTWQKLPKHIEKLAIVNNPRVSDAAIYSAFAQFAAKRNSASDQADIQSMHDISAKLGAGCDKATYANQRHSTTDAQSIQSLHDTCVTLGADCPGKEAQMSTPTQVDNGELLAQFNALKQELDRQKAENAVLFAERRKEQAVKFADDEIASLRAYPAEKDIIVALFERLAGDDEKDAESVVSFAQAGTVVKVNRVSALKALFSARKPHGLTSEQVKIIETNSGNGVALFVAAGSATVNGVTKDGEAMSKERHDELMGIGGLGQEVQKAKK